MEEAELGSYKSAESGSAELGLAECKEGGQTDGTKSYPFLL